MPPPRPDLDSSGNLANTVRFRRRTTEPTEAAVIRIALGAKKLERDHELTILFRPIQEGPRPAHPPVGFSLYRVDAAGADKAGIVASLCRLLAERGINIADLTSRSRPGPGGSPHYELSITAEVPNNLDTSELERRLESEANRLVIDIGLAALETHA